MSLTSVWCVQDVGPDVVESFTADQGKCAVNIGRKNVDDSGDSVLTANSEWPIPEPSAARSLSTECTCFHDVFASTYAAVEEHLGSALECIDDPGDDIGDAGHAADLAAAVI